MARLRRFSAHIGNLFTELPFAARFAAAARCSFAAMEFPDPYETPASDIARWLQDNGLSYVQLGVIGDTAKGDKGLAAIAGRESEFRDRLEFVLDYAAVVGAHFVHVLGGIVPPEDRESAWPRYLDNLALAVEAGRGRGQAILIEAMSPKGASGYFLDDPRLALEAIRRLGSPANLGLMVDVFHSANAGVDPAELIREAGKAVVHVHLADHPGRHEPGTGAVDFAAIVSALDDIGYDRLLGCEYLPVGRTDAGLGWMRQPGWHEE